MPQYNTGYSPYAGVGGGLGQGMSLAIQQRLQRQREEEERKRLLQSLQSIMQPAGSPATTPGTTPTPLGTQPAQSTPPDLNSIIRALISGGSKDPIGEGTQIFSAETSRYNAQTSRMGKTPEIPLPPTFLPTLMRDNPDLLSLPPNKIYEKINKAGATLTSKQRADAMKTTQGWKKEKLTADKVVRDELHRDKTFDVTKRHLAIAEKKEEREVSGVMNLPEAQEKYNELSGKAVKIRKGMADFEDGGPLRNLSLLLAKREILKGKAGDKPKSQLPPDVVKKYADMATGVVLSLERQMDRLKKKYPGLMTIPSWKSY